jgi:hypothetical protein
MFQFLELVPVAGMVVHCSRVAELPPLRDGVEYKFLGCIQDHHQLRIAICGESATHLANRSMRTQDVYVGTFPRFIRNISICC